MTITLEQLHAYEACHGDIDGWSRSNLAQSRPHSGENWTLLNELIMGLRSEASGYASSGFSVELRERIDQVAPDLTVQRELRELANRSTNW